MTAIGPESNGNCRPIGDISNMEGSCQPSADRGLPPTSPASHQLGGKRPEANRPELGAATSHSKERERNRGLLWLPPHAKILHFTCLLT